MADALVERSTGTPAGITRVEIQLVMTDRTLLQADSEPARLPGYGTVPAGWARTLINGTAHATNATAGSSRDPGTVLARTTLAPPTIPGTRQSPWTERRGRDGRPRCLRRVAPPALHPPGHRRPRRDGLPRPDLPARAPPPHPDPRRHLPHPLLRRPHPPPGPHHPLAPRRTNQPRPTAPASAKPATTPKKPLAGPPAQHPDLPPASAPGTPSNSPPPPATPTIPRHHLCPDRLLAKRARRPAASAATSATTPRCSSVFGPQAHWRPEGRTDHKPSRVARTRKPPADRNDQRAA